jgi:alcohol dehydrogenase
MTKRKSYQLKAGNLNNIQLVENDLPDPAAGEVTIAIKSIGFNFADIFAIWGLYGATPKGVFIPGLEYSGVVTKTGAGVTNVNVGDKIMGVTRFGAYTTHLNIDARYVLPLPESWSFEEGAAYLVQVLTAYYGLVYLGNLQKEQTVLIHSAAGGVGIWANRIARKYEAFTIGSIGNASKIDFCKKEKYDKVVVRSDNFSNDLKAGLGDRELNIVMECIGGKIFQQGFDILAPQGRMIVYGAARYASVGSRPNYLKLFYQFLTRPKIDPQKLPEMNKSIMGFNLIWLYERAELMHELLKDLGEMNLGKPHVGHTFPFEELKEAIYLFQSGKTIGKVVLQV